MEAETTQSSFATEISVCGMCKSNLSGKDPKLLLCLHTFCQQCLQTAYHEYDEQDKEVACPVCKQMGPKGFTLDNYLVELEGPGGSSSSSDSGESDQRLCTACEDNIPATSFCTDCSEYLCDQCVQAHKRVRITKDHTIQPKENAANLMSSPPSVSPKRKFCPKHKTEELKLFCVTCDKLTCRDCQLREHMQHTYSFVDDAAEQYKTTLTNVLNKVRDKKDLVISANNLIDKRNAEIDDYETKVTTNIKLFALQLISEVNRRGKKLLADLASICTAKRTSLNEKKREIQILHAKLEHAYKFAEFTLEKGDNHAALHTKRFLLAQLKNVIKARCEVPNPNKSMDIQFKYDKSFAVTMIPRQGVIVVDGVPYQGPKPSSQAAPSRSTNSPGNTSQKMYPPQGPSSSKHYPPSHQSGGHHMSKDEQRHRLMLKMQHMHMQQQRMQSPPINMQQAPPFSQTSRLSHMPHQSSAISSSKQVMQKHHGPQGYFEGMPGMNPNLMAMDQMRRNHIPQHGPQPHMPHQGPMMQPMIPQNPIVIQPAGGYENNMHLQPPSSAPCPMPQQRTSPVQAVGSTSRSPSSHHPQSQSRPVFQRSNSVETSRPAKSEVRSSCSYASGGKPPSENTAQPTDPFAGLALSDFHFDDDPLAFLENIKKEADKLDLHGVPAAFLTSTTKDSGVVSTNHLESHINLETPPLSTTPDGNSVTGKQTPEEITREATPTVTSPGTDKPASKHSGAGDLSNLVISLTNKPDQGSADVGSSTLTESPGKPGSISRGKEPRRLTVSQLSKDPNEDWCAVCHNGGDILLCCDRCPKVFHFNCHVPNIETPPSQDTQWFCRLCQDPADLRIDSPSVKLQLSSSGTKRKASLGLSETEIKVCERILLELFAHEESVPFHEPVSKSVLNYYKIIQYPMDLSTVKAKLQRTHFTAYETVESFLADIRLIFQNCATYNHVGKATRSKGSVAKNTVKATSNTVKTTSHLVKSTGKTTGPESEVAAFGKQVERFFEGLVENLLPYIDFNNIPHPAADTPPRPKRKKPSSDNESSKKDESGKQDGARAANADDFVPESAGNVEPSDGAAENAGNIEATENFGNTMSEDVDMADILDKIDENIGKVNDSDATEDLEHEDPDKTIENMEDENIDEPSSPAPKPKFAPSPPASPGSGADLSDAEDECGKKKRKRIVDKSTEDDTETETEDPEPMHVK